MAIPVPSSETPRGERRGAGRRPIDRDSTVRHPADGLPHAACVHDLSRDGLRLETPLDLAIGTDIGIGLPGIGRRVARVVRRDGDVYGCRFAAPVATALLPQAFAGSSLVFASFARLPPAPEPTTAMPEPDLRKWHPAIRIGLMLGLAAAMWTAILRLLGV